MLFASFSIETWLVLAVIALIALNGVQLLFWSWQYHRLIDKIMCRNYAEYVQVKKSLNELPQSSSNQGLKLSHDDELENERILRELNGVFNT